MIRNVFVFMAMGLAVYLSPPAFAAMAVLDNANVTATAINGGAGTVNPGTTCITVSSPVSGACAGNFLAIPNNNPVLLSAALTAKSTGGKVWIYYSDSESPLHCPGLAMTPCSITTIMLK